jgi:hypothetical protein
MVCGVGLKVIGFILILLAVSIGVVFGFHYYFGGGNKTATFGNLTGVVSTIVVPTPPERFVGGTYTAVSDSLRLEVTISNSSVRVGDVLWAKIYLFGTEGEVESLKVTVFNFRGEKVDELGIWLPHRTFSPGERVREYGNFTLMLWTLKKISNINMEIVPGNYTIILEATTGGRELDIRIPIKVVE